MFKLKFVLAVVFAGVPLAVAAPTPFDQYYHFGWGHMNLINESEVQLVLDEHSGGGFRSNLNYLSGVFHIQIKLSQNKSRGEIVSFFLSAERVNTTWNHNEFDFEFFVENDKYILRTNIFNNDGEHREEAIHLWFDPTTSFHDYQILWNPYLILFSIDNVPIRVFKNYTQFGLNYPTGPMHIETSIWTAHWAGPIDYSKGPFSANYRYFALDACAEEWGPGVCNATRVILESDTRS